MQRPATFPSLPGYNFDSQIDRKHYGTSHKFGKIHDGVYYLTERPSASHNDRYSLVHSYDHETRIPPWLEYDGQRLMFKAFFQETVQERWKSAYQIRVVTISFFLEDGTIKIVEPSVSNSGLEQGVLVRRQRISMPDPIKYRFYDINDLNIGKEPEIFGRVYKIVDCDKFTRRFLNRMGIAVPDPTEIPLDPYNDSRLNLPQFSKKFNRRVDTLGKFLKYDRKVLKFYGYWDDSHNEYGTVHDLEIRYHLADDSIEIKEVLPPNSAKDISSMFLKRMKIPKFFSSIDPIGANDPFTVLNVLGDSTEESYFIADSLNIGKNSMEYYKDSDLTIGVRINVFGREVVITDMDPVTREYYRTKYGIDEFEPLERPSTKSNYCCTTDEKCKPPPHNGFGSYDDSLGNCFGIVPKPAKPDHVRIFQCDKQENESNMLRFRAKMVSKIPENDDRHFIINVYLMDNTISIFELAFRNTGFQRCLFQKRMQIMLPGQNIYSCEKPKFYEPPHFFIGAVVNLGKFSFEITSADEYTLCYMESKKDAFIKANSTVIMDKIRATLNPEYKSFIQKYKPSIMTETGAPVLTYNKLKEALYTYLRENIVEHEIITIARNYWLKVGADCDIRENVRSLVHTELKRFLWDELERLEEDINHWDLTGCGFLSTNTVYTILRGARLPVDAQLIDIMLNKCVKKDKDGKVDCKDLITFLNVKINPATPVAPIALKTLLNLLSDNDKKAKCYADVDWCKFINDLGIKEDDPVLATAGGE